jgi:telomere length regulation protein
MVVGEAVSDLVNKGEKRLDFHMDETNQDEGKWYKGLVEISDTIGNMEILTVEPPPEGTRVKKPTKPKVQHELKVIRQPQQGFIIEEIEDDEDEDDDLVPYAKPDSDAEDSDEDATLVRRDKPKAPVYVRDLIRFLRDSDNYDHQKLALQTAPLLIRRKAKFGTEVRDHAEELASILVSLQDKFEMENFSELRSQAMIALVVAQPEVMAQWFAKTFFDGDYSISQRASILAVLGIGARELAGFETSEYSSAASFPTKTLPEQMERLYLSTSLGGRREVSGKALKPLPSNALDMVAQSLTTALLAPMAADAADSATGPDILKLSTISSRLKQHQPGGPAVKRKTGKGSRANVRIIPNTTASLIYSSFFSPLIARFQAGIHSSASRALGIIFQPYLLSLYLKTLAVLLHAAGPSTLALPQMTADLWGVLLSSSVRAHCVGDLATTHAVLFALLAMLDVNEDRMRDVCSQMSHEVVETQEWVAGIYEGIRGGDGSEENDVKLLAAAVLIRLRDGMEKYRLLLVGDMIGF